MMAAAFLTARPQESVTFEDVAVYFTEEEWTSLVPAQRALYKAVMLENYGAVFSVASSTSKPALIRQLEQGKKPYFNEPQRALKRAAAAEYMSKMRRYIYLAIVISKAIKSRILQRHHCLEDRTKA